MVSGLVLVFLSASATATWLSVSERMEGGKVRGDGDNPSGRAELLPDGEGLPVKSVPLGVFRLDPVFKLDPLGVFRPNDDGLREEGFTPRGLFRLVDGTVGSSGSERGKSRGDTGLADKGSFPSEDEGVCSKGSPGEGNRGSGKGVPNESTGGVGTRSGLD